MKIYMIDKVFQKWKIQPTGIIHIGANFCTEREFYSQAGCDDSKVVWIASESPFLKKFSFAKAFY